MRRTSLFLLIGIVAVVAALSMGAVAPVPSPQSSEVAQLKKEVESLRQRVDSLEQQLKKGLIPAPFRGGRAKPDIINPYPWPRQVPPDWKPFEFNGMTYYIVPIDQARAAANDTPKQAQPDKAPAAPETADHTSKP